MIEKIYVGLAVSFPIIIGILMLGLFKLYDILKELKKINQNLEQKEIDGGEEINE